MKRTLKILGGVGLATGLAFGVAACEMNPKEVHASPQFIRCIYDDESGELKRTLSPGEGKMTVDENDDVFSLPTTQRFWSIHPDTDQSDPGASEFLEGNESGLRAVQAPVKVEFYIRQDKGCELLERHLIRNINPELLRGGAVDEDDDILGFNARGDDRKAIANLPWFKFLIERFDLNLVSLAEPLFQQFAWPYYDFNLPVNANSYGVLPMVDPDDPDCQVPDGTAPASEEAVEEGAPVPDGECEHVAPGPIARDVIAEQLAEELTNKLREVLGDDYFCGPGYNAATPDICPPLLVTIPSINLVEQGPVTERRALMDMQEQAANDAEEARLIEESTDAELARIEAENERDRRVREAENQAAEDQAADQLAVVEAEGAVSAAEAQNQAAIDLAPCILMELEGPDCANLLLAMDGQVANAGNISVNVGGNPSNNGGSSSGNAAPAESDE